jgi:hypothetical protein
MRTLFSRITARIDAFEFIESKRDRARVIADRRRTELAKRVKNVETRPS